MREFMTKVSDYLNEMRNNPERKEDRLAIVIIGVAAAAVIVLLLLVLWGHIAQERRRKEDESVMETATFEEKAPEYMSQNDGQEALRQEYLESIEYLNDKVEELLATLEQAEQNLSETMEQYREGDTVILEKITSLHTEVNAIVQNLKETQTKLYDLIDIVQIMNEETIPMIQAQITQMREDIGNVHTDIANLYAEIAALQKEDAKLWASINNVEKALQTVLNQNMTEVNDQLDTVIDRLEMLENRIGELGGQILRYRYDEEKNTLYLEPYNKSYAKASEPEAILSQGNLALEDGSKIAVNSSDILYLQEELKDLFDEVSNDDGDHADLPVEYDRRNYITSKGVVAYAGDTVAINSANLTYLADEIDRLEWIYKYATVKALNRINTYYTSSEGDISHDSGNNNILPETAGVLSFKSLYQGITKSQSVDYLANVQAKDSNENLLYYADENARDSNDIIRTTTDANDFPVLIGAASANHLTAGTAAWVDGKPVIGNGADNKAQYDRGYGEGYGEGYEEGYDNGRRDAVPTDSITISATLRPDYDCSPSSCQIPIIGAQSVTVILEQHNNRAASGSFASINDISLSMSRAEGEEVVTKTWTKEEIGDATFLTLRSASNVANRELKAVFTVTINY